ncbi:MAG TPA: glucoamylase family protein, partial [Rhodothermales bacterium]
RELHMRTYFTGSDPREVEIRALADSIYERVDWQWAQARPPFISHGWRPESGFIEHDWVGYNEAMILYVLALGSPTFPVGPEAWDAWTSGYSGQWQTHYGYSFLTFPPLFGHQYSHVWIDFRGIQDEYMRAQGIDYFENSRRATLAQRAYHIDNPRNWPNYGPDEWGLTASDTPTGYAARGAPPAQNDDGTLVPTAPGGSIVFTPDESIAALRTMYEKYPSLWGPYGFRDAYNVSRNWFDQAYLGIDQGPILLMIENYRTESIWQDFMQHEAIRRGLVSAGFTGEPLSAEPEIPYRASLSITLYPNPAQDHLTAELELPAAGPVRVAVFDVLGRRVLDVTETVHPAGHASIEIPTTELAPGVYFVRVSAGEESTVRPFVRVR